MRKLVSFMHVSLDGFVAGPNGEMNWIKVDEEIFDYAGAMTAESDLALYGRNTFNMMEGYWPTAGDQPGASRHDREHSAWYNKTNKLVVSRSMKGHEQPMVRIVGEGLEAEMNAMKKENGGTIVIFGSPSATHSLTQLDLVDEFRLFVNPILLGVGTPMFSGLTDVRKLKLEGSKAFASGVVMLHYSRVW